MAASPPTSITLLCPGSDHGWYLDIGHGEDGSEERTNTHAVTTDSTATWNPTLQAGQCYEVGAFVPNNYSDSPTALYQVTDALPARHLRRLLTATRSSSTPRSRASPSAAPRTQARSTAGTRSPVTVSAFVPDNYSNSSSALCKLGSTVPGSVNENAYTNGWAVVGTMYTDGNGSISTTLLDNSPAGEYVAADAVQFLPESTC